MATSLVEPQTSRRSIRQQLILSALIWGVATIGLATFALLGLFRDAVEGQVRSELNTHLVQLISITEQARDGTIRLSGSLPDPRYQRPLSSWSWQVRRGDTVLLQSASLGPAAPQPAAALAAPTGEFSRFVGPLGAGLIGTSRRVAPRFATERLIFAIARPEEEIEAAASRFRSLVLQVLGVLGIGQVLTVLWLMRAGLKPLEALRERVATMRRGETPPMDDTWPQEIAPIASELSELEQHVERLVGQARGQASDLAHAIKTPLTVLRQIGEELPKKNAAELRRQTDRIEAALARHLARMRSHGRGTSQLVLASVVDDVALALRNAYRSRALDLRTRVPKDLMLRCDENDLFEILGNPMDNACKWARTCVRLDAKVSTDEIVIDIEDDGPGVPGNQIDEIFKRGVRLDESADGHGLGLTITRDLVQTYDGTLDLGRSDLGGLHVRIRLQHGRSPGRHSD